MAGTERKRLPILAIVALVWLGGLTAAAGLAALAQPSTPCRAGVRPAVERPGSLATVCYAAAPRR